ncbi:putative motility protein [Pelomonas sp. KK5]|uniref:putative motility protein n=1 Tax=Pelomonas sp. KK5 TaxID=1855730 RepID=UPI00097C0B9A|nr:putative motility protein [Pelomonas sp. KK5]
MNITNSTAVNAAVRAASNGTADSVGTEAGLLVLRKAIDAQASGAAALLDALPQPPVPASEGTLGRNVDTYA